MAKRFTDTEIWNKEWFLELNLKQKLLMKFIFDNCDCAGIYEPSYKMLKFYFNQNITEQDFLSLKQVEKLPNGKFFLTDFIKFQYFKTKENHLNPRNNAHLGVIKCLIKNGINHKKYLAPSEPLVSPCLGALDKELELDKDMDMDMDNSINLRRDFHGEYSNVFLDKKNQGRLLALILHQKTVDELINDLSVNIEKGKVPRYDELLPNAHLEVLKSYWNYRRKHPEKFNTQGKKEIKNSGYDY